MIRKIPIHPHVERVPLVVVQRGISFIDRAIRRIRRIADQPTRDRPALLCQLIGIGQMDLPITPQARRMQRHLPALNQRPLHSDRDEDTRLADITMIEKIIGAPF